MEGPLAQLAIIWIGVFIANLIAVRTRLTAVLYFLAFGAIMVNLGALPQKLAPFINGFAELGIVIIMFALGFEENTQNFMRSIKRSWGIAFFGALAPFLVAFTFAKYMWQDTNVAIMCGLTMTATAVSLTMVSLKSLGLQSSKAATGIMTSAVLDDVASLAAVAVMVPIATGAAEPSVLNISMIIGKALLFFAVVALVSAYLLPQRENGWVSKIPLIGPYGVRDLLNAAGREHASLTVLLFALLVGLLSHEFGFHAAVGAYMAGLILREEYFLVDAKRALSSYEQTREIVDSAAFSWIGPVFFVALGTKIVLDWDLLAEVVPYTAILLVSIVIAQVTSAALAARYTGGFTFHESMLIGFGMLGRAELAFVVLGIAYVQNSIFSTEVFYTLMLTIFWLNVAVPVSLTLWKPAYKKAESAEAEAEAFS